MPLDVGKQISGSRYEISASTRTYQVRLTCSCSEPRARLNSQLSQQTDWKKKKQNILETKRQTFDQKLRNFRNSFLRNFAMKITFTKKKEEKKKKKGKKSKVDVSFNFIINTSDNQF